MTRSQDKKLMPAAISRCMSPLLALAVLSLFLSCRGASPDQVNEINLNPSTVSGRYARADAYSDQAKIILQYSLNGSPFEEVHPCSTRIIRDDSAEWRRFKTQIDHRQGISTLRILDLESGNLGGQVLCFESDFSAGYNQVLNDEIACHFVNGDSDIPWNPTLDSKQITTFLNLPTKLFLGQPPDWFSDENITKSEAIVLDGQRYVDLTFQSTWGEISCRFDSGTETLLGMRLPSNLLSKRIAMSSGIGGVTLAILFEESTFEAETTPKPTLAKSEIPLQKFVKLPQEFPSETIGATLQSWGLANNNGKLFDPNSARNADSVFFYGLEGQFNMAEFAAIESMINQNKNVNFGWINPVASENRKNRFQFSRMGYFVDAKGEFLSRLGVKRPVFVLICDKDCRIQFIAYREKDWLDKVSLVLGRLRRGDDVAREMHTEYAKYYKEYRNRLLNNQASQDVVNNLK